MYLVPLVGVYDDIYASLAPSSKTVDNASWINEVCCSNVRAAAVRFALLVASFYSCMNERFSSGCSPYVVRFVVVFGDVVPALCTHHLEASVTRVGFTMWAMSNEYTGAVGSPLLVASFSFPHE